MFARFIRYWKKDERSTEIAIIMRILMKRRPSPLIIASTALPVRRGKKRVSNDDMNAEIIEMKVFALYGLI